MIARVGVSRAAILKIEVAITRQQMACGDRQCQVDRFWRRIPASVDNCEDIDERFLRAGRRFEDVGAVIADRLELQRMLGRDEEATN